MTSEFRKLAKVFELFATISRGFVIPGWDIKRPVLVSELVPWWVVSTVVSWWVNAESSVGQFGWIALLHSCPGFALCTTSTIVVPYIIEFIQPIETPLTKMGPATRGFTWYAFFHHRVEKDFNLVLNVELKTLYLCASERGYSTGCYYYHRNCRILTIDNCCAHCQATLRFSTSDSKQP